MVALLTGLAFMSGAIPFSVILGKIFLRQDIRRYGDGNPGAANAWRAGGAALGAAAVLADLAKAFIPVALAVGVYDLQGMALVPVAIAPVFGHAFSPLLGFRGGKAIAATYGIWLALIGPSGPLAMGVVSAVFFLLHTVDAWTVTAGLAGLFVFLWVTEAGSPYMLICGLNCAIVVYKHSGEFRVFMKARRGWRRCSGESKCNR